LFAILFDLTSILIQFAISFGTADLASWTKEVLEAQANKGGPHKNLWVAEPKKSLL